MSLYPNEVSLSKLRCIGNQVGGNVHLIVWSTVKRMVLASQESASPSFWIPIRGSNKMVRRKLKASETLHYSNERQWRGSNGAHRARYNHSIRCKTAGNRYSAKNFRVALAGNNEERLNCRTGRVMLMRRARGHAEQLALHTWNSRSRAASELWRGRKNTRAPFVLSTEVRQPGGPSTSAKREIPRGVTGTETRSQSRAGAAFGKKNTSE